MTSQPPADTTYFPKGVAASGKGGRKATFFYDEGNNRAVIDVTDRDNLANLQVQSSKPGNLDVNIAGNLSVTGSISGGGAGTVQQDPVSLRVFPIDEGTVAGNARGVRSTDFQMNRALANQVASGLDSGLLGGESNRASGARSAVVGGLGNSATTDNAAAMGGAYLAVSGINSFSGGGYTNAMAGVRCGSLGGQNMTVTSGANYSGTVGGDNMTVSGSASGTVGGDNGSVAGNWSVALGGSDNQVTGSLSGVLAGASHRVLTGSQRCGAVGGSGSTFNTGCNRCAALGGNNATFNASVVDGASVGGQLGTVAHSDSVLVPLAGATASATNNQYQFKVRSAAPAGNYATYLQTGNTTGVALMGGASGWVDKGAPKVDYAVAPSGFVGAPGGFYRNTSGAAMTFTFATAASIIGAGFLKAVGDSYTFTVAGNDVIDFASPGASVVLYGNATGLAAERVHKVRVYCANVTGGSEEVWVAVVSSNPASASGGGTLAQAIAASVAATESITLLGDLSQDGGDVSLVGASAVGATDAGGDVILTGGAGGTTSGTNGAVTITSGASSGSAATGTVAIRSANKTSGAAGSGSLTLGTGTTSANSQTSGSVSITSGNASGSTSSTGAVTIASGSPTNGGGPSGSVSLQSGNATFTAVSGSCTVGTGTSVRGNTGGLTLRTGAITSNNGGVKTSGSISMTTGAHSGSGSGGTGSITIATGADNTGDESGSITLVTGAPSGGSNSGAVVVSTGAASSSHASLHPGHVYLRPGSVGGSVTSTHAVGEVVIGGSQTNTGRHMVVQQATAPTVTNGAKASGFSELSDAAGTITADGTSTDVTVTFTHTYEAPPHVCVTFYAGGSAGSVQLDQVLAGSFRVFCTNMVETFTYFVMGGTPHA